MPGLTGPAWAETTDWPRSAGGVIQADALCRVPQQRFKLALMCIVDTLSSGLLVWRTPAHNWALPPLRVMHWVKRGFEWLHLRRYRRS